jgi:hypothetical protein
MISTFFSIAVGIFGVAVFAPLPNVAQHVMETEVIGPESSHRRCKNATIRTLMYGPGRILKPSNLVRHIGIYAGLIGVIPPMTTGIRTAPTRILPFRLGGQPILTLTLRRKPLGHSFSIIP